MQETSSAIMLVSFAVTVLSAIFNPNGRLGTALTSLGERLAGRFDQLLTMAPDAVDMGSTALAFVAHLFM